MARYLSRLLLRRFPERVTYPARQRFVCARIRRSGKQFHFFIIQADGNYLPLSVPLRKLRTPDLFSFLAAHVLCAPERLPL